jgi:hypothetical protein
VRIPEPEGGLARSPGSACDDASSSHREDQPSRGVSDPARRQLPLREITAHRPPLNGHVPEAVIPYDGTRLMDGSDSRIDRYSGLAAWWRKAEEIWLQNRSSEKRTLLEQIDYLRQLSAQFPIAQLRVVYTKAGNTLAAAMLEDHLGVIGHKLYWAPITNKREALYLIAILNAGVTNQLVKPYQSVGAFGPRDFDKYVWQAPIPGFNPENSLHGRLARLAEEAQTVAQEVELGVGESFQRARRLIRESLSAAGISAALDDAVRELFGTS